MIEAHRLMAEFDETHDDVPADESRSASDENFH
jgi:hypothetical protein